MDNPYRIKIAVLANGERLPIVLRRADGLPLHDPTVYVLSQIRARSGSAATVERHLRGIMHLLVFAEAESIDLEERIHSGKLLTMHELDALTEAAGRPIEVLVERLVRRLEGTITPVAAAGTISLERYRSRLNKDAELSVVAESTGTRLRIIRDYLRWLAARQIGSLTDNSDVAVRRANLDAFIQAINARVPNKGGDRYRSLPEGLSRDQLERLLEIVSPGCAANPWKPLNVRVRNQLIIHWLYRLGIRRGELLAIRVGDIKGTTGNVNIKRRPDSLDDPRTRQPLVKTSGRDLPLGDLFKSTQAYIFEVRKNTPGAAKHPFLFVENRKGRPLSHSGLTKIFSVLSNALGFDVAAHLLRHSWNDAFSAEMDRKKVPEATEKKVRSYLQGWKETSNTSSIYTRRHVRETAERVLLKMQEDNFKRIERDTTDDVD